MRVYYRRMSSSSTPSYHWVGTPSSSTSAASTSAAIMPTGASYASNELYQPVVNRPIRAEYDEFGYEVPAKPWWPSSSTGSSSTGSSSAAAVVRPPLSLEEREKAMWLLNFHNPKEEDKFKKTLDELKPPISIEERFRMIEEWRKKDFIKLLEKAKIPLEKHADYVQQWSKTPYKTTVDIITILEKNDPVGGSEGGRRRSTRHKQHKKRPRKHRRRCSTRRR